MSLRLPKLLVVLCVPFVLSACNDGPTAPTMNPGAAADPPSGPEACVTTNPRPAVVAIGEPITLNASCSQGGLELVSYEWDLGDGRTKSGMVIHPRYGEAGAYRVRLIVVDAQGREDSAEIEIRIEEPLQACMEWTQVPLSTNEELAPCGFRFDATCSTGDIREYRWFFQGNPRWPDFDDATITTTEPHVTYTWREDIECFAFRPFERIVRLTVVAQDGETSTVEEVVEITMPLRAP